jgi:hypothetical protein
MEVRARISIQIVLQGDILEIFIILNFSVCCLKFLNLTEIVDIALCSWHIITNSSVAAYTNIHSQYC